MFPAEATVMFPSIDFGFAVALAEPAALAVGAGVDVDVGVAFGCRAWDDAAAERGDRAAADEDGAETAVDSEEAARDGAGADEYWLAEQPATARAAKTAQAVAIFTLS